LCATAQTERIGIAPDLARKPPTCDDSPHTVTLNVLADSSGPPFKKGPAVFSASASAAAGTPCGPGCLFDFVFQNASLAQVLKMK
jgi:hypothetical protein